MRSEYGSVAVFTVQTLISTNLDIEIKKEVI